jgi:membrane-associated phospholipid phosphatase
MRRPVALALAACVLVVGAAPVRAEPTELSVRRGPSLAFSLGGGLLYLLSETAFKDDLAPSGCRWCDGDDLNGVDRGVRDALVWDDPASARTISNVTGYVGAPLVAFGVLALAGREHGVDRVIDDELIVFEAVIGAGLLNQGVKFLVGRERPFVRALPPGDKPGEADDNLSFYSGHTSLTFSLAVASGTVASLRGYREAPWIWATGLTLAGATGYLRIAGDKHYFTDVVTGAVVGSFVGFAVPYWLHRSGNRGETSALGAGWSGGPVVSWSGTF